MSQAIINALKTTNMIETPASSVVNVGTTSTTLLSSNTSRKYALLVNDSDEDVYIKLGATAVLNQGIRINANGGSYELSLGNGNLYTGSVNGICLSGSKKILVTEALING